MAFSRPKLAYANTKTSGFTSPTAAFRSTGKTYEFHKPTKNAAPIELTGEMIKRIPENHKPATWENLLESSLTIHQKPYSLSLKHKPNMTTSRTIRPEFQDPVSAQAKPKKDNITRNTDMNYHGITNCERKHNERCYVHTFQLAYSQKNGEELLLDKKLENKDKDIKVPNLTNIDEIGCPNALQIKDCAKYIKCRSYL